MTQTSNTVACRRESETPNRGVLIVGSERDFVRRFFRDSRQKAQGTLLHQAR